MYKPILFNTEMVQAIKEGRKTQTRRIIKLTPGFSGRPVGESGNPDNPLGFMYPCGIMRPPCNKGDILWVRETWHKDAGRYMYRANCAADERFFRNGKEVQISWRPSIHMPKEAARIFLRVKYVRVERLMDMSEADCMAEGIREFTKDGKLLKYATQSGDMPSVPWQDMPENPKDAFWDLWNSTIKPAERGEYGFLANPWVWVIEFERIEKPEDWV